MEKQTTAQEKVKNESTSNMAVIAYLTLIGLIIAFVINQEKKEPFTAYHIRQSLGIGLTGFALGAISVIPIIGWLISIIGFFFTVYLWIMGLMNAINQKEKPVPILGEKYEEWFQNI